MLRYRRGVALLLGHLRKKKSMSYRGVAGRDYLGKQTESLLSSIGIKTILVIFGMYFLIDILQPVVFFS